MLNTIIKSSIKNIANTQIVFKFSRSFSTAHKTTVDTDDVVRFSKLSNQWWDLEGEFKLLHTMNRLRIPLVRDRVDKKTDAPAHQPLLGLKILDVGCGGGILSEPLSRLGASVVGLDASDENVLTAKYHQSSDTTLTNLTYIHSSLEDYKEGIGEDEVLFDGVVLSEIVEHVNNLQLFMDTACTLVKPGGSIFVTTINRTQLSYWTAIFLAEKVLKVVPEGIHDWEKFVKPQEIKDILDKRNFSTRLVQGMCLNPLTAAWTWIHNPSVNYALHAIKCDNDDGSEI